MPLCRTDAKCPTAVELLCHCLKQTVVLRAGAWILFTLHLVCLYSSRLPLSNCSHHSSRISGSPSEGPRKDSVWGSPGGTSHSHPCLPRVSTDHKSRVLCTTVSNSWLVNQKITKIVWMVRVRILLVPEHSAHLWHPVGANLNFSMLSSWLKHFSVLATA